MLLFLSACTPGGDPSEDTGAPRIGANPVSFAEGDVRVRSTHTESLSILNIGDAPLDVMVGLQSGAAGLSLDRARLSLDPSASAKVTVTFAPESYGDVHTGILLWSNDPVTPDAVLPFSAHVVGDTLVADADPLWLGNVTLGATATGSLTVQNDGAGDVTVTGIVTGDPAFTATAELPATVHVGERLGIEVSVSPTETGDLEGGLFLVTDIGETPVTTVTATALE